jgi:hypothetical protein
VAVLSLGVLAPQARAQVASADSLALVALYNATNGPNWSNNTNWLTGPVSTRAGIGSVVNGRVVNMIMGGFQISGVVKDGTPIAGLTRRDVIIGSGGTGLVWSDAGVHSVQVTNPVAPLLTLAGSVTVSMYDRGIEADSLALVELYNTTGGSSWDSSTNWLCVTGQVGEGWLEGLLRSARPGARSRNRPFAD